MEVILDGFGMVAALVTDEIEESVDLAGLKVFVVDGVETTVEVVATFDASSKRLNVASGFSLE